MTKTLLLVLVGVLGGCGEKSPPVYKIGDVTNDGLWTYVGNDTWEHPGHGGKFVGVYVIENGPYACGHMEATFVPDAPERAK